MARIPYPIAAAMGAEVVDRLSRLGSLNVNRMMAHAPNLMIAHAKLGYQLLRHGKLDPALRELVILRIGTLCSSAYEWHQHISIANALGVPAEKTAAVKSGVLDPLTEKERAGVEFAEQVHMDCRPSDSAFAAAALHFSNDELVEITLLVGYYTMTAMHLRTFDVEIEDTAPLGDTMVQHGVV